MMNKITLLALLFLLQHIGYAQCKVLEYIADTITFDGITISYVQQDSMVDVTYGNNDFKRKLSEYSFPCNNCYLPSIPKPIWRNNNFICFLSGCGTSCFNNILAPLNSTDSIVVGGQVLIDTASTLFFSIYHDTLLKPYLEVKNYISNKFQIFELSSDDFVGAVPLEHLNYEKPHSNGFIYENQELTLFFEGEKDTPLKIRKFKIDSLVAKPLGH